MKINEKIEKLPEQQQNELAYLTFMMSECPWLSDPSSEWHATFGDISKTYKETRQKLSFYFSDEELNEAVKLGKEYLKSI